MRKICITGVIVTISAIGAFAQNAAIQGIIFATDGITSLAGVSVFLDDANIGTATNSHGIYTLDGVPPGSYKMLISSIGYLTVDKEIIIKAGETLTANFTIIESIASLSEVTVIAGGTIGLKDIPGSVHYISPLEIEKFSYTDVSRTLRTIPGINIQEEDGFGLRPNIGLRGTGAERSSKITVMEDGVLMAPAPYAAPAAYYFPTIGRMQGVEILKGSSQIKYGPYTTGGAINLLSTQIPSDFSGRVHLIGGSFGGRNLHAYAGNSQKNIGYAVETFQYSSNGFKELDGGGDTGFDKEDYVAKLRFNTNKDAKIYQSLTFKIGETKETSNETYLGLTQEDFDATPFRRYAGSQVDVMNTEQSQYSLTHFIRFSEIFNSKTTAYRTDFTRNWYKLDKVRDSAGTVRSIANLLERPSSFEESFNVLKGTTSINEDALMVKANNRTYYAQGVQTVLGFNFQTKGIRHEIDLGLRYHRDQIDRFQWVDEYAMDNGVMKLTNAGVHGTESNRIETADAIASYVQYQVKFSKFTVTPGLRLEHITTIRDDFGINDVERSGTNLNTRKNTVDVFIPGIGIDYRFNNHLSTFAGMHKGFAPPGSKEETQPEESINYEWGIRYAKNALSGQAVFFYNDYHNLLGTDLEAAGGGGTGSLFNGGEVRAKGLEFELTYDLLSSSQRGSLRLPLSVVYTYTDAVFQNDFDSEFEGWGEVSAGDQFPYLAKHQFALVLSLEHHLFSFNLSGRFMDEMRTSPGQDEISVSQRTDSYFVVDASANFLVQKHISLFANATNLTNQVYIVARRPAGLRPGMPNAYNVGLKVNF